MPDGATPVGRRQARGGHVIDQRRLHGRGLGWVDVHLLASSRLTGCRLWTRDKALAAAAQECGVARS
jgi:predicted nucleic acid-binding protein